MAGRTTSFIYCLVGKNIAILGKLIIHKTDSMWKLRYNSNITKRKLTWNLIDQI